MAQQNIPTQATPKTIAYANLLGVDYQSDPTEVSRNRSPEMVNMISDLGGNPVKRFGYRNVGNPYKGFVTVNGEDWAIREPNSVLVKAYKISIDQYGEISETFDKSIVSTADHGEVKHVFAFQDCIYVLCEKYWIEYDTVKDTYTALGVCNNSMWHGETTTRIALYRPEDKYIPTVMTMMKPISSATEIWPSLWKSLSASILKKDIGALPGLNTDGRTANA